MNTQFMTSIINMLPKRDAVCDVYKAYGNLSPYGHSQILFAAVKLSSALIEDSLTSLNETDSSEAYDRAVKMMAMILVYAKTQGISDEKLVDDVQNVYDTIIKDHKADLILSNLDFC